MSEKLSLQWNDFQENIKRAFGSLREGNNFADVTLACGDDQQVEAHKVILAASSLFSRICLEGTRRLKSEDFLAVVKASTQQKYPQSWREQNIGHSWEQFWGL